MTSGLASALSQIDVALFRACVHGVHHLVRKLLRPGDGAMPGIGTALS